ncbi:MAG: DUF2029 domain-containing protein [Ignavibacteria bacterium]|nr:DUF2029 domain-containing protein [Ignavibacteria bacterium]
MYDDEWFKGKIRNITTSEPSLVLYVNPPTVSLVMIPLVGFDPFTAKMLWNVISILLLAVVWIRLITSFGIPSRSGYKELLFVFLACSVPFLRNLQRGQMYILMLFFVFLLWLGYSRGNHWLTGLSLASMILLKYFGWMFLLLFAVEKRWKDIGIAMITVAMGAAMSISVFGTETFVHHFYRLVDAFHNSDFSHSGLPCVAAFFGSLFVFHPAWNPNAVADVPWLASLLTLLSLITACILTISLKKTLSRAATTHRFFAVLVLSVIFTPLAADHHYILLSLPLFVLLSSLDWQQIKLWQVIGIIVVIYLIMGWLPSLSPYAVHGWKKFIPFLRLYGAITLWFMLVYSYWMPKRIGDTIN